MKLKAAMTPFLEQLNPRPEEHAAVTQVYDPLLKRLMKELTLQPGHQGFLAGSWARGTAITPVHDVDLFCVLAVRAEADPQKHRPSEVLKRVEAAARRIYGQGLALRPQPRSIQLRRLAAGAPHVTFDIVPAFTNPGGHDYLHIPDERADRWIRTNPKTHQSELQKANSAAKQMLIPLIRVLKRWNQHKQVRLSSFYLEVMCSRSLTEPPRDLIEGLAKILDGLALTVRAPVLDPAGVGPNLDQGKTADERSAIAARFQAAAAEVRRAQAFESASDSVAAHRTMRGLLGSDWFE